MGHYSVPRAVRGLDDDVVKVGRPVVGRQVVALLDVIHHQFCWCRPLALSHSYQWNDTEVATPTRGVTAGTEIQIQYRTGYNTTRIRVTVVCAGGVTRFKPAEITIDTTTDATTHHAVADRTAPGTDFTPSKVEIVKAIKTVTPDSTETVTIDQASTIDTVRILSVRIEELPAPRIDTVEDPWAGEINNYAPSRLIYDTVYDDIPLIMQVLRRFHKKVLFAESCELATNNVGAGNREDLIAKSTTPTVKWALPLSVRLPEATTVPVTCSVLAHADVVDNGSFRFDMVGADADIGTITNTYAWYSATANINKSNETVCLEGNVKAAGTLRSYAYVVEEDQEAT